MTHFAPRHSVRTLLIVAGLCALAVAFCAQPGLNLFWMAHPQWDDVFAAILPTAIGGLISVGFIVYAFIATRWMLEPEPELTGRRALRRR